MEKLRQDKEAWAAKFKLLKQQKLEAEWKEAERQAEEWLQLEAEAKKKELALEKEHQEVMEHLRLADLKEKEKEDEANELALQAAGALSASDRDSKIDPADLKMAAMAELKRRWKITKRKRKAGPTEP